MHEFGGIFLLIYSFHSQLSHTTTEIRVNTMDTTPTSICVLRLSAIGDCINALALVQILNRNFPHAEITWVIGKAPASLFE